MRAGDTGARDRMVRVLSLAIGAAGVLFLLINEPSVHSQLPLAAPWWNTLALTVTALPAALLAVGAFWFPVRWLRVLATVLAVGELVTLASTPLGFTHDAFPNTTGLPWPVAATSVAICVVPLAMRPRMLLPYILTFTAAYAAAMAWALRDESTAWLVRTTVGEAVFGLLFAAVTAMSLRGGEMLDTDTARLRTEAAARAHTTATTMERSRVDALVHDAVLSALLAGGRGGAPEMVRSAAGRGVAVLDDLAVPQDDDASIPAEELIARLRQICADLDEGITFRARVSARRIPVKVAPARVLQEVTGEAVRDSLRHAHAPGRTVTRSVHAHVTSTEVWVRITDDGIGFDPARVPPDRLRMTVGLRERVAQLPGAQLRIDSTPDVGTAIAVSASPTSALRPEPDTADLTHGDELSPPATTAPHLVGMHLPGASLLALAFLLSEALRPFEIPHDSVVGGLYLLTALALMAGIAILVTPSPDPLPLVRAATIAACAVLAAVCNGLILDGFDTYTSTALWAWSTATLLLAFMTVRGRFLLAWAAAAAIAATYLLWIAQPGTTFTGSVVLTVAWQLLLLGVCSLFAMSLRRQVQRINTTRTETILMAAERGETQARLRERDAQLRYLETRARPLLERMRKQGTLQEGERQQSVLVEARLRDRIRARALATEAVLDAAQAARARGVEVILLDDGALDTAAVELRERVTTAAVEHLDASADGRLTIRVLPPGRPALCTIVHASDEHYERTEITRTLHRAPTPRVDFRR